MRLRYRTLCGKIDRDILSLDLPVGFGRSNIDASALEHYDGAASIASLDCRAFLGDSGHMLLAGTADLSLGLDSSSAKIAGPVGNADFTRNRCLCSTELLP